MDEESLPPGIVATSPPSREEILEQVEMHIGLYARNEGKPQQRVSADFLASKADFLRSDIWRLEELYRTCWDDYRAKCAEMSRLTMAWPLPVADPDRDMLGRTVREAWVHWASHQPDPKPSWLVPYGRLDEADKEADRQIGEAVVELARRDIEQAEADSEKLANANASLHSSLGQSEKTIKTLRRSLGKMMDKLRSAEADRDKWMEIAGNDVNDAVKAAVAGPSPEAESLRNAVSRLLAAPAAVLRYYEKDIRGFHYEVYDGVSEAEDRRVALDSQGYWPVEVSLVASWNRVFSPDHPTPSPAPTPPAAPESTSIHNFKHEQVEFMIKCLECMSYSDFIEIEGPSRDGMGRLLDDRDEFYGKISDAVSWLRSLMPRA